MQNESASLDFLFASWAKEATTEFGKTSVNIKPEDRAEAIQALSILMLEAGFGAEDFKELMPKIAQICIPQNKKIKFNVSFARFIAEDLVAVLEDTFQYPGSEESDVILGLVCKVGKISPPEKKQGPNKSAYLEKLLNETEITYGQVASEIKQKTILQAPETPTQDNEDEGIGEDPEIIASRYLSIKPPAGTENDEFVEIDSELEEFLKSGALGQLTGGRE